jgi:hypothetical protein
MSNWNCGTDMTDALEIRFHSTNHDGTRTVWQLLVAPASNGALSYTLHRFPRNGHTQCVTNLLGTPTEYQPLKAYAGWSAGVTDWLNSHQLNGKPVYTIDEVL